MPQNKMKIAVTATGPTLDDTVEPRFGRCPYFLIIEPDSLEIEPVSNPNISRQGGAGIQSAQLMAERGVSVVLTGNCGPNAFRTFGAAGIKVITGVAGSARQAVERFKAGEITADSAPSVESHFGMGRKMGGGPGRGPGGGIGRGRGMGNMGNGRMTNDRPGVGSPSPSEEVANLRQQANELRTQIESIESKLRKLEGK